MDVYVTLDENSLSKVLLTDVEYVLEALSPDT